MNNAFNEFTKGLVQSVTRCWALKKCGISLAGLALACLGLASNEAAGAPTYTTIDYPDSIFNVAADINADGQIVGRYIDTIGMNHGYLLSGGTFTDVTFPGAVWTRAMGINRSGDIVGDYSLTDPRGDKDVHGFLLHHGTFTSIDFPGAAVTVAQGINRNGDIVGFYTDNRGGNANGSGLGATKRHGFLLSGGVFTPIDVPGSGSTEAWKVNDHGQIVGRYLSTTDSKFHIYRLIAGTFTPVGDYPGAVQTAPGGQSHLGGLNSNGDITSAYNSSKPYLNLGNAQVLAGLHGFLLSGSSYTSIDFPAALATMAFGINDVGLIVGVYENPDGTIHGYLRTP